jgi:hypothetical protein
MDALQTITSCPITPCSMVKLPDFCYDDVDNRIHRELADAGYGLMKLIEDTFVIVPLNVECAIQAFSYGCSGELVMYLLDRVVDFRFMPNFNSRLFTSMVPLQCFYHPAFAQVAAASDADDFPKENMVPSHRRWLARCPWIHAVVISQ